MQMVYQGVNVHYEQTGQGKDVLFLHGWGCSTKHFEQIINLVKDNYRVTVLDFPAHGLSDKPNEPWGVQDFAQMTMALMDTLSLSPVDIVAHSFGARVAIYIASHFPEKVHRLLLTGAAGIKPVQTEAQKQRTLSFKKKKAMLEKFQKVPVLSILANKLHKTLQQKYGSKDYNALDDDMKKTFVKIVNEDLTPCLKDIKAPTLLVFGENDSATPLWMGQKMEKEIKDCGLVVFENQDHFAYLRQPQRFATILKAFLT